MINDLKPYPSMKGSGVPSWLGHLPSHWALLRMKTVLRERVQKGFSDEPLLAATQSKGVVRKDQFENRTVLALKDLHLLKLVQVGDFVISLRSFQGGIEYAREQGIISPAYTILYTTDPSLHSYLSWLFKSRPYIGNLSLYVTGIRQGQNIDYEKLGRSELPIPPPAEQSAIARFLDHADRQIRRYIRAKQKLIKLLEEQKQNVIHHAVTKGLDPSVRLKAPDVEGLPCIPEHWAVRSFTRMAIERADYRGATPAKKDTGVFLVTARNVRKGWIDYHVSQEFVAEADYKNIMRRGLPRLGDLLLTMEAPLGHAALVDREDIALAQRVVRFRFDPRVLLPQFVLLSVLSPYFQDQLLRRGTGSTALGIKASKLPQLRLVFPPVDEQQALLDYIDGECKPMDAAALRARTEFDLLREYRTRLIADVVTGKVDVRQAAAGLLENLEEPEAFDEDGLDSDSEEAKKEGEAVDEEAEA